MEALEAQAQATQEKENAVTKQNMKYTMSSSRGIYLSWLTGRADAGIPSRNSGCRLL